MSNQYALNHARLLHSCGLPIAEIKKVLVCMTNAYERREIIASLEKPTALAA